MLFSKKGFFPKKTNYLIPKSRLSYHEAASIADKIAWEWFNLEKVDWNNDDELEARYNQYRNYRRDLTIELMGFDKHSELFAHADFFDYVKEIY